MQNKVDLEARLEQIVRENPDRFSLETVERVRKLIEYETQNPGKNKRYSYYFQNIEDFALYYDAHIEWQGKSPVELEKEQSNGGKAFYTGVRRFVQKTAKTKRERYELTRKVFPTLKKVKIHYSDLRTVNDWVSIAQQIPKLDELPINELRKSTPYVNTFYTHLEKWMTEQNFSKKKAERDKEKNFLI